MSNFNANSPLFLGSAALNIFLVAFILGRLTGEPHFLPPPMFWGHGGPGQEGFMRDDARADDKDRERPPLFGPDDLFTKEEREANLTAVNPMFDQAQALRQSFAKHLKDHAVTKDEVVKHFEAVDTIMEKLVRTMQARAAEKLASMPAENRAKFAEYLMSMRSPPREQIGVPGLTPPGAMRQAADDAAAASDHDDRRDGHGPDHFHGPHHGHGPDFDDRPDHDNNDAPNENDSPNQH